MKTREGNKDRESKEPTVFKSWFGEMLPIPKKKYGKKRLGVNQGQGPSAQKKMIEFKPLRRNRKKRVSRTKKFLNITPKKLKSPQSPTSDSDATVYDEEMFASSIEECSDADIIGWQRSRCSPRYRSHRALNSRSPAILDKKVSRSLSLKPLRLISSKNYLRQKFSEPLESDISQFESDSPSDTIYSATPPNGQRSLTAVSRDRQGQVNIIDQTEKKLLNPWQEEGVSIRKDGRACIPTESFAHKGTRVELFGMGSVDSGLSHVNTSPDKMSNGLRDTAFHAVTLRAPWATSLIFGGKRVENRNYPINLWTGQTVWRNVWLAIHVSSSVSSEDTKSVVSISEAIWPGIESHDIKRLCKHIIGICHISRVTQDYNEAIDHQNQHQTGSEGWVLDESRFYWLVEKVIPINDMLGPLPGKRRVWKITEKPVIEALTKAVRRFELNPSHTPTTTTPTSAPIEHKDGREGEEGKKGKRNISGGEEKGRKRSSSKKRKRIKGSEFTREDISLTFHIMNQTGNGRISVRDIIQSAKTIDKDINVDYASEMIKYASSFSKRSTNPQAHSTGSSSFVSMSSFMALAEDVGLCPAASIDSD
ncbi:hypothetical protein AAMO2058_000384200 [Amorphochlora amoebiformis]